MNRHLNPSLVALADRELSVKARAGHVALLLGALSMTIVIASLWLTEPALPVRTQVAFGVMTAIGLGWALYAGWVLRSRLALLAFQEVVASRLALTFCSAALAGALALAIGEGVRAAWSAAAMFAVLLLLAAGMLARARRRLNALTARRAALEQQLGAAPAIR